jgi:predicted PurR-regulated permease PerM
MSLIGITTLTLIGRRTRPHPSRDLFHLLTVVVAVVAIATLYFARVVLIPFALALLFTFILAPVVRLIERFHFGRVPSTLLVAILLVATFGAIGWTVTKQLGDVVNQLPDYKSNIKSKLDYLHLSSHHTLDNASQTMTEISKDLAGSPAPAHSGSASGTQITRTAPGARPIAVELVKSPVLPLESLQSVLGLLASALIVTVFAIFMLIRREDLRNRLIFLAGEGRLSLVTQALDDASERVSRYLLLQFLVNTCFGIFIGVCLHFIGVPAALLWGAIAGILRFLPYIGPPLGALMPLLLSLAVFTGWQGPLITLSLFVITELIVSNLIEPMLYGAHTGISSLAIVVAAIFWTAIWGPIGLVLSTPLTVCLVVLGRHVPRLSFLHVLLGDEPVLTPDSRFYQRLLATDHDEARQVLQKYLEGSTLLELYDSVLIPALSLAEQDRHQNRLEDATEKFICPSTRELIDEFSGLPASDSASAPADGPVEPSMAAGQSSPGHSYKVLCLPARDEADEIVATMLAQLIERAGHEAQCVPLGSAAEMLAQVKEEKPDFICISALPPFAIAHARALYAKLRTQAPSVRIDIGLWNFSGDPLKVSHRLALREESRVCTKLAEFIEGLRPAPSVAEVAALLTSSPG